MEKIARVVIILYLPFLAFLLLTAYDMTVYGFYEPLEMFPPHYNAGAGSWTFLIRFCLALASVFCFIGLIASYRTWGTRFLATFLVPLPLVLLSYSITLVEKVAVGFDDESFSAVVHEHHRGDQITKEDALARLGSPLMVEKQKEEEIWSFTYMPSGGFGWRKRLLIFDEKGQLVRTFRFDEP